MTNISYIHEYFWIDLICTALEKDYLKLPLKCVILVKGVCFVHHYCLKLTSTV